MRLEIGLVLEVVRLGDAKRRGLVLACRAAPSLLEAAHHQAHAPCRGNHAEQHYEADGVLREHERLVDEIDEHRRPDVRKAREVLAEVGAATPADLEALRLFAVARVHLREAARRARRGARCAAGSGRRCGGGSLTRESTFMPVTTRPKGMMPRVSSLRLSSRLINSWVDGGRRDEFVPPPPLTRGPLVTKAIVPRMFQSGILMRPSAGMDPCAASHARCRVTFEWRPNCKYPALPGTTR